MTERERHVRKDIHQTPGDVHHGEDAQYQHGYVEPTVPAAHANYVEHQHAPVAEPTSVRHTEYDEVYVPTEADYRLATLARLRNLIYFIASAVSAVILLRFVLLLLGANPNNAFANLIYTLSYPFVAPFLGIFGNEPQYGRSVLEIPDLLAIAVYYLLAWAIVKILALVYAPPDPSGTSYHG